MDAERKNTSSPEPSDHAPNGPLRHAPKPFDPDATESFRQSKGAGGNGGSKQQRLPQRDESTLTPPQRESRDK